MIIKFSVVILQVIDVHQNHTFMGMNKGIFTSVAASHSGKNEQPGVLQGIQLPERISLEHTLPQDHP